MAKAEDVVLTSFGVFSAIWLFASAIAGFPKNREWEPLDGFEKHPF